MNTNEERVDSLRRFGYSEEEATFLCLAALHGGYFLRRQYCRFRGTSSGRPDDLLARKVLSLGHGKRHATCRRTFLYHLSSRAIYGAIGEPDSRNRHPRPPFAIRSRLMALDYVLDHRGDRSLATEHEKLDYFCRERGVPPEYLPARIYRVGAEQSPAWRYFPDSFPIFTGTGEVSAVPPVTFCYVDEGVISAPAYETFVRSHAALFGLLGSFRVVHISTDPSRGEAARGMSERFMEPSGGRRYQSLREQILSWLHLEDLYLRGLRGGIEVSDLDELAVLRRQFQGRDFGPFVDLWKEQGRAGVARLFDTVRGTCKVPGMRFEAECLAYDYGFL